MQMNQFTRKISHHEIDSIDKQCAILIGQAWINKHGGNDEGNI